MVKKSLSLLLFNSYQGRWKEFKTGGSRRLWNSGAVAKKGQNIRFPPHLEILTLLKLVRLQSASSFIYKREEEFDARYFRFFFLG